MDAETLPKRSGAYDLPYRYEVVDLDDLGVDASYQRPLTTFWKSVRDDFNPAMVGTLIVSERKNGSMHIIDGQTRAEAMRAIEVGAAPCLVYSGLSKEQEARLFADLQTKRRGMKTYDRFRAQLVAKDAQALKISKIAESVGFKLGKEQEPHTLMSIAALERCYRVGPEHLEDVLVVIREAWGTEDRKAVHGQILGGVSTFIRTQERMNMERLMDCLHAVQPSYVLAKAGMIREGAGHGSGASRAVAQAISAIYASHR